MAKAKTKTTATPVAQSREEVEQHIGRIGEIQRELTRQEADLGDQVADVKTKAEAKALPLKTELGDLQARVQGWCEANRAALTREGRVKFADFATGKVNWRARPPKVGLRGVEAIIAALKANRRLAKFLRTKVEIDKEAMQKEPELARTVPGVTIGSEGEDFIIEPFEADLVQAVAS